MPRSAARLAALAAAVVACGEVPAPRRCASAAECPADARCIQELCVADAPPVAAITAPSSFQSNVSYAFGSSGSYDPDAGDSVVSRQWTVAAAQAPCQASPDAAATESLVVVFPCAGSFDVKLVVTDELGVPSAPRALRVSVAQSVDPPVLAMGPDLALDHRCAGDPLVCTPVDALQATTFALSASATSPAGGGFAYRWRYQPPADLDGKPAPAVTFDPDETSPAPVVAVTTQGTALAGEWTFVMEATDSRGLTAVGAQRVAIGNRPPEIQGAGAPLIEVPHVFNPSSPGAATGTMAALGETPTLAVSDPDGDPLQAAFTASHSGDGASAFLLQDLGTRATFSVVVQYGDPADGAFLIGPGVSRSISFTATDTNGAVGTATWEVRVGNRPPRVVGAVASLEVPHGFDPAGSRYRALASLSTFADDDGDPLSLDAGTGGAICAGSRLAPATLAAAEVECTAPYAGTPAANAIAGLHSVTTTVRDAWAAASATTNLTIGNRAPRLAQATVTLTPTCSQGSCCLIVDKVCESYRVIQESSSGTVPSPITDDDGDPILVSYAPQGSCPDVSPASQLCIPGACVAQMFLCGDSGCGSSSASGTVAATATDGDLSTSTSFTVAASCASY